LAYRQAGRQDQNFHLRRPSAGGLLILGEFANSIIPCANTLVVDRFSMGGGSRRGGKFSAHVSLLPGAVEQVLD
jgi:hypothetical protein